jgi:peptidyl-prolyl cis-trans isomerase C
MFNHRSNFLLLLVVSISLFISSCSNRNNPTPTAALPTETAQPATPTSLPMAIRINGSGILLTDYQEDYQRLESALKSMGKTITPDEMKTRVIDNLVGSELLNQAAKKNGYSLTEQDISSHIDQLTQTMGGPDAFNAWKKSMFYSDESFHRSVERSMGSAWQRDQILKSLPDKAEQVHARQILFVHEENAIAYRQKIDSGSDFAELAKEADPVTGGDLGWFPKGYLQPEVETAAFTLQPGEVSAVIKSAIGYHLVQVIEKDPARLVDPDAKTILQHNAINEWVKQETAKSKIEILVP